MRRDLLNIYLDWCGDATDREVIALADRDWLDTFAAGWDLDHKGEFADDMLFGDRFCRRTLERWARRYEADAAKAIRAAWGAGTLDLPGDAESIVADILETAALAYAGR